MNVVKIARQYPIVQFQTIYERIHRRVFSHMLVFLRTIAMQETDRCGSNSVAEIQRNSANGIPERGWCVWLYVWY